MDILYTALCRQILPFSHRANPPNCIFPISKSYNGLTKTGKVLINQEKKRNLLIVIEIISFGRVSCIALCPNWLNTRLFVSGSDDGYVKLWNAQTYSYDIAHNTHLLKKEVRIVSINF